MIDRDKNLTVKYISRYQYLNIKVMKVGLRIHLKIKKLLDQDNVPDYSIDCDYCTYILDIDTFINLTYTLDISQFVDT